MNDPLRSALWVSPALEAALAALDCHLFSEGEIAGNSLDAIEGYSGIYFLLDEDKIVYVGQSTNVYSRLSQHISDCWHPVQTAETKKFTKVTVLMCHRAHLNALEAAYIRKFLPKYNKALTGRQNGSGPVMRAIRQKTGAVAAPSDQPKDRHDSSGNNFNDLVQIVKDFS